MVYAPTHPPVTGAVQAERQVVHVVLHRGRVRASNLVGRGGLQGVAAHLQQQPKDVRGTHIGAYAHAHTRIHKHTQAQKGRIVHLVLVPQSRQ